jgi:hypothetical protein
LIAEGEKLFHPLPNDASGSSTEEDFFFPREMQLRVNSDLVFVFCSSRSQVAAKEVSMRLEMVSFPWQPWTFWTGLWL